MATGKKKKSSSSGRHVDIVRSLLSAYAVRGVLREFDERAGRGGKTEFRFTWLLDRQFVLTFDPAKAQFVLKDVLHAVAAKSDIDQAMRAFVSGRSDKALPPHRRIDPSKMMASVQVRGGTLSIVFDVKRSQYGYAVPKILNFCNELFGHLNRYHIQYMWAHMGVPEE